MLQAWRQRAFARFRSLPLRLHGDQRGSVSLVAVFGFLLLAMLLGMTLNIGRQVDSKVRMQNAADAAAYSGAVVLARGMNDLAFTNHLLADVFGLTAFLREARDRHSEQLTPEILAKWDEIAPVFSPAEFERFARLGGAISQKTPLEVEMIAAYSEWAAATSEAVLPTMELILAEELIPQYQRALVAATPQLAHLAAEEAVRRQSLIRDGELDARRGAMHAFLWKANGAAIGGAAELQLRTLPVVDPVLDAAPNQTDYRETARKQRNDLALHYLRRRNAEALAAFRSLARMSQFAGLWEGFTQGQLERLFAENVDRNLPHVIRRPGSEAADASPSERNRFLEEYMCVATVYWKPAPPLAPGLFTSPIDADVMTFAQAQYFIPNRRLVRVLIGGGGGGSSGQGDIPLGGVEQMVSMPPAGPPPEQPPIDNNPGDNAGPQWDVVRQSVPTHWDLLNQRWAARLTPATAPGLPLILQTPPPFFATGDAAEVRLPNVGNITVDDLSYLNHH